MKVEFVTVGFPEIDLNPTVEDSSNALSEIVGAVLLYTATPTIVFRKDEWVTVALLPPIESPAPKVLSMDPRLVAPTP